MKKWLIAFVAAMLALGIVVLPISHAAKQTKQKTVTVLIKKGAFEPKSLTIKANTKVTFKNVDTEEHWPASNDHPTHKLYPQFDAKKGIPAGKSWSFVFKKVGTWGYHDHWNPSVKAEMMVTK